MAGDDGAQGPNVHPQTSLANIFKRLGAFSSVPVATTIVSWFAPSGLVPDNVEVALIAAGVLALIGVLAAWAFQELLSSRVIGRLILVTLFALIVLVILHQVFGAWVDIGSPPEHRLYLVGFTYTSTGRTFSRRCGTTVREDLVECAGPPLIEEIWGWSYALVSGLYLLCFFILVMGGAMSLTSAVLNNRPDNKR